MGAVREPVVFYLSVVTRIAVRFENLFACVACKRTACVLAFDIGFVCGIGTVAVLKVGVLGYGHVVEESIAFNSVIAFAESEP